ncbi:flagellar basal body P-ring formation chaperone FlgA [Govanella unica]|uniref:Flagella basal body P-ring formation protein FlgA n=1 Tax=Govanella unica TaxID=2975056 RepID=A0A9X3Z6K3_9PROT|nr:flagellar basal body P-ring formation chaperone FlgA [Govania unica]MDA5193216.1 flagellar basal body P-ring formation chaperone FlgA [Govania unica]
MQNTSSIRRLAVAALIILGTLSPAAAQQKAAKADMTMVPGLARALMPGEIIGASDIAWVSWPTQQITQTIITDGDGLIGRAVRRPMPANVPVRFSDVQRPVLIKRGAIVTMIVKTPDMTLTTSGRAQENGGEGDLIRLTNTNSNRTVSGVVLSARDVMVSSSQETSRRVADLAPGH